MNDLGDLFNEADANAAREAGDSRLESGEFGAVRKKVRNAHTRRAVLRTFLVAGAAFALGAAAVSGMKFLGGMEVADLPSPSPTTSSSATAQAWPGFDGKVSVDPHLPDALAITPEVWTSVQPGWALISYREDWPGAGDTELHGPQVIYLVSPIGDRYELTEAAGAEVDVLAWDAGSTTAVVSFFSDKERARGIIDLVTGEVTQVPGYGPDFFFTKFLDANGDPVYSGNGDSFDLMSVHTDGSISPFVIPAERGAAELAETKTGLSSCWVAASYDVVSVLVECTEVDSFSVVVRVWPDDGRVEYLYNTEVVHDSVSNPTRAGSRVVASQGSVGEWSCPTAYVQMGGGGETTGAVAPEIAPQYVAGNSAETHPDGSGFVPIGLAGDSFLWGSAQGCLGTDAAISVIRSNLASGTFSVLMPYPEPRPAGEHPYNSVNGVAIGR